MPRFASFRKYLLIAVLLVAAFLTPALIESTAPNWSCLLADVQVALAAPHQACWTECTSWHADPCGGYSSCYDKDISCNGSTDQDGRSCQGCCFSCKVVCDPPPDRPPTINGTLNCSAWGDNNWCIGSETLDLTASDPQGASLLISGDLSGTVFACQQGATSCAIPLPEGTGLANYRVLSALGLSDSGSKNWLRDSFPPSISGSVDQSPNALNWFNTAVNLTASANDPAPGSGLAVFETSLDNSTWIPYTAPLNFTDGTYTVYLRATDNAGNMEVLYQGIQIDSQNPQLSRIISGLLGANNWYISPVIVEAFNTDPAPSSGIQSFATSLDGTNWATYTNPLTLTEGIYILQIRVIDNADNQDSTADAINIDTTPPSINGTLVGTQGAANWYISSVQASVATSDATSGIALTEYSVDGGAWQSYTSPITFSDGFHQIQFRTTDTAGLISETEVFDFKIDTTGPHIKLPSRWYIWESGEFVTKDHGSKIVVLGYEIRDPQNRWKKIERSWTPKTAEFSYTIAWNRVFADGIVAPIGSYNVTVYAEDEAGNRTEKTAQIIIPQPNANPLPTFTPTPTATKTPLTTPTATGVLGLLGVPTATPTPFVFTPPQPTATEEGSSGIFSFFSSPADPTPASQSTNSNILWGTAAAAVIGTFNAVIAERKRKEAEARRRAEAARHSDYAKRRAAEKKGRLEEYLREKNMTGKERKERAKLQAIWDANGAAIYDANQQFKTDHGKEMDSATRNKAIADATENGVFNAGAYAAGLSAAAEEVRRIAAMQSLNEEIHNEKEDLLEEKLERDAARREEEREKQEKLAQEKSLADWKRDDLRAADEYVENKKLQDGLRKAGEATDVLAEYMEGKQWSDAIYAAGANTQQHPQVPSNSDYPIDWKRNTACVLPSRIYLENGINSEGPVLGTGSSGPDDDSLALENLLVQYGYQPDNVTALQATYITEEGISDIQSTIFGSFEVLNEYFGKRDAPYTLKLFEEIQKDLIKHPLSQGQCIVVGGHSGGGAPAPNLAGFLEDTLGVEVEGIFTMGSPVSDFYEATRYAEQVLEFRHQNDLIGLPIIRTSPEVFEGLLKPIPTTLGISRVTTSSHLARTQTNVFNIILDQPVTLDDPQKYSGPVQKAHASYMHDQANSLELLGYLNDAFGLELNLPEGTP